MCGKFTAKPSWSEVVDYAEAFSSTAPLHSNDRNVTFRVMHELRVILWDKEAGKRRVVSMRWGYPNRFNWKIPQPIHARCESIETTPAFAQAFHGGQRGIVIVRNFNEAPDVPGSVQQHTITPGDLPAIGIAFVWQRFEIDEPAKSFLACVMVTVPANELLAGLPTDRMPAVLAEEDWATWLGEESVPLSEVKGCLKTVESVRWTMSREEQKANTKVKRRKPTVSDPGGLL